MVKVDSQSSLIAEKTPVSAAGESGKLSPELFQLLFSGLFGLEAQAHSGDGSDNPFATGQIADGAFASNMSGDMTSDLNAEALQDALAGLASLTPQDAAMPDAALIQSGENAGGLADKAAWSPLMIPGLTHVLNGKSVATDGSGQPLTLNYLAALNGASANAATPAQLGELQSLQAKLGRLPLARSGPELLPVIDGEAPKFLSTAHTSSAAASAAAGTANIAASLNPAMTAEMPQNLINYSVGEREITGELKAEADIFAKMNGQGDTDWEKMLADKAAKSGAFDMASSSQRLTQKYQTFNQQLTGTLAGLGKYAPADAASAFSQYSVSGSSSSSSLSSSGTLGHSPAGSGSSSVESAAAVTAQGPVSAAMAAQSGRQNGQSFASPTGQNSLLSASGNGDQLDMMQDKWTQGLSNRIERALRNGHQEIELVLNPRSLGKMKLRLAMADQQLNVSIRADNMSALTMLQDNEARLAQMLEAGGIRSAQLSLSAGAGEQSDPGQQPGTGQQAGHNDGGSRSGRENALSGKSPPDNRLDVEKNVIDNEDGSNGINVIA